MARRKSSIADDLVLLPWWVSLVLAGFAALLLPSLLPPSLHSLALLFSLFLVATAALSAFRSWKNTRMLEEQTGIDSLHELPWKKFEDLLGEVYRRQGYSVEETLGGGPDGGVDLLLRRDGVLTLVQCKQWPSGRRISVEKVRELYGVLHDRHAQAAKFVATTTFTRDARAFAEGKPIELVDSHDLLHLLRGVQTSQRIVAPSVEPEGDDLPPACPRCGDGMEMRKARRGVNRGHNFWGCPKYPKCLGTRSI